MPLPWLPRCKALTRTTKKPCGHDATSSGYCPNHLGWGRGRRDKLTLVRFWFDARPHPNNEYEKRTFIHSIPDGKHEDEMWNIEYMDEYFKENGFNVDEPEKIELYLASNRHGLLWTACQQRYEVPRPFMTYKRMADNREEFHRKIMNRIKVYGP